VFNRLLALLGPLVGLCLVALAVWVLNHELRSYSLVDIAANLREIPTRSLLASTGLTLLGYLALTGYDALAFRFVGAALSYPRIALASFLGFVFSHNVGVSFLGGGAVRYRVLGSFGISGGDVARVVAFNLMTFWLGFLALGGAALALDPPQIAGVSGLLRAAGWAMLAAVGGYLAWGLRHREPLQIAGFEIPLPGTRVALLQIAVSAIDWMIAVLVLAALLPAAPQLTLLTLAAIYMSAQVAGLISQIPGGLGAFDGAMLFLLRPYVPADAAIAAIFAYRIVYYLLPFGFGIALFAAFELAQQRARFRRARDVFGQWAPAVVPRLVGVSTGLSGAILLASGATPPVHGRFALLARFLPLPAIEISHFLGSSIGAALLLLARAIQRRVDAAYFLVLALLVAGIAISLIKGLDWEEASALAVMGALFVPTRRFFDRKSALLGEPFSLEWVLAIGAALLGSFLLVMLSFRHVEYANELWWRFELSGHASRALRALAGAASTVALFSAARLLRPTPPLRVLPSTEELERAREIAARADRAQANLALLGDKALLFAEGGEAFVMYAVTGRTWVAMGDPVGGAAQRRELVWRFRELADESGGRAVFYEVSDRDLSIYAEAGLSLLKIGEEARVSLGGFSLEGGARRALRQARNRIQREGCRFEILSPDQVPPLIPELREVSDAWLEQKSTREKHFSLGFFEPRYVAMLPVAVVRQQGGHPVAFATVWPGGESEELSIDLMRYGPEAPSGVMDFLFAELMLWGRDQGYRWFSLGMAPLAGLEQHRLAPLWNRAGALLFRYGDHFYGFRGLHAFKEKFAPNWEPRFLAHPAGLPAPLILAQIASLISGGPSGILTR